MVLRLICTSGWSRARWSDAESEVDLSIEMARRDRCGAFDRSFAHDFLDAMQPRDERGKLPVAIETYTEITTLTPILNVNIFVLSDSMSFGAVMAQAARDYTSLPVKLGPIYSSD